MIVVEFDAKYDPDEAWFQMEEIGCQVFYSTTDDNSLQIFCDLPPELTQQDILHKCQRILAIHSVAPSKIDWEAQWAEHAQGYHDGYLHVDLQEIAKIPTSPRNLKLHPGPGFGDLSHPTTRLMLHLMPKIVLQRHVLDVGCGSGILSLAAKAMGAASVYGIDIDDQALIHSDLNAKENRMDISFMRPEEYCKIQNESLSRVVLINMIQCEQNVAWASLSSIHNTVTEIISSGILADASTSSLMQYRNWGWRSVEQIEENGWVAFHLVRTK